MNTSQPELESKLTNAQRREEIRNVLAMSIPIVITTCSRLVMDLADFTMITHLDKVNDLNGAAQGAIMSAQLIMWTFIVLGLGTISIVNTFVSQSLGRGRNAETSAYAWQGIYMGFAYSALCLGLYGVFPIVINWIGHSERIAELELIYCNVMILSIAPTIAGEALASFFNGIHRPKVTMWSAIEANILNIAVSWILMFGLAPIPALGFAGTPALGFAGAAWGTVVGVSYRFVRLLLVFLAHKNNATYSSRTTRRIDGEKMRSIIRVGVPQGFQWISEVVVWMLFVNVLIGRMFEDADLIASSVAWQFMRISFMPAIGVGIALSSLVGKAVGQGNPKLAMRYAKFAVLILVVYMGTLSIIYLQFRRELVGWFNDDPQVIDIAARIMICAVIFQVSDALGITYNSALRGAGDTFWPAMLYVISHWVIVIGGGWAIATLKPEWGSIGPWSAATFLLLFLSAALWWRWSSGAWQKINIFAKENESAHEH
ncbi:MAG: MATE family efflux transporter [Phycisphaerae bacterium]|nr:MAG: MATE family efflux transporter [Phycisphaerae bacterium]